MKKALERFTLTAVLFSASAAAFAEHVASVPVPNKGDTAWMLVATVLVIMMTLPGLALFYGGLVRVKNMLSVLAVVNRGCDGCRRDFMDACGMAAEGQTQHAGAGCQSSILFTSGFTGLIVTSL